MTRRIRFALPLLAAAGIAAAGTGCRRAERPATPTPPPSTDADSPEARAERARRATAVAGFPAQPGITSERCPTLQAPDFGARVTGKLEEGVEVAVVLVEPGFYGIRTAGKELAFVSTRSIRLLPEPLKTPAGPRPRREIVPQINPLPRDGESPAGASPSPTAAVTPAGAR